MLGLEIRFKPRDNGNVEGDMLGHPLHAEIHILWAVVPIYPALLGVEDDVHWSAQPGREAPPGYAFAPHPRQYRFGRGIECPSVLISQCLTNEYRYS
jgi:hypothetical protein